LTPRNKRTYQLINGGCHDHLHIQGLARLIEGTSDKRWFLVVVGEESLGADRAPIKVDGVHDHLLREVVEVLGTGAAPGSSGLGRLGAAEVLRVD
jgi:hypothetical protein